MDRSKFLKIWNGNRDRLLGLTALFLAVLSLGYLAYHFWRLLFDSNPVAAIDLQYRYSEVSGWFSGRPIFREIGSAVYPPASYAILWPLLGWLSLAGARWLWGITSVFALIGLAYLSVRESGADTFPERALAAVIPLSLYPTGVTVGNGQVLCHFLPLLAAGLLLVKNQEATWPRDLLGAFLVILGFVKPSVSTPFFWILLFVPGRSRPALLVCAGYLLLSLLAVQFQESGLIELLQDWVRLAQIGVSYGTGFVIKHQGYTSVPSWLYFLGLGKWATPVSLTLWIILGYWIHRNRRADFWTLMGVSAVVARFWTYHLRYDDLVMLLAMIAFFRIAKKRSTSGSGAFSAGILLAATTLTLLAPGGTNFLPQPLKNIYVAIQIVVWLSGLIFLVHHARLERSD